MTDIQLQDALYDWANAALNDDYSLNIPIVLGEQNAPRPKKTYIVIHRPGSFRKHGQADKHDTNSSGVRKLGLLYVSTITIEVVGGNTEYLRYLLDSVYTQEILNLFGDLKISFLRSESIIDLPNLQEDSWELRSVVDCHFLFYYTRDENVGYIDDVDYTNNIL